MKLVTPKQIAKTINLIQESGIRSDQYQALLESGRLTTLLLEFMKKVDPHTLPCREPTITPINLEVDYKSPLTRMRDTGKYYYVNLDLNSKNFPVEIREGTLEFLLVFFDRDMDDNENPSKSALLRELDQLGLQPEGPLELCALGKQYPELQQEFPIVARRQVWRHSDGNLMCPVLTTHDKGRAIILACIESGWVGPCRFLCSRKPKLGK